MSQTRDLTQGNITSHLVHMAIPLIGTSFIQTTYNLIDMIWIGKLGSSAVAAVGTASFFINMSMALAMIFVTGTGIKISHHFGAKQYHKITQDISNGVLVALVLGMLYGGLLILFQQQAINFFRLNNPNVQLLAERYLRISMVGTPIIYVNLLFTSMFNSFGNSRLSFKINSVGLITNIVLDPLLIFGIGSFAGFQTDGAAYATVLSRLVVCILFLITYKRFTAVPKEPLSLNLPALKEVSRLGLPHMVQRVSFIFISMFLARLITQFGDTGIAVQKIGVQIEALSYMTIGGLHGAMSVFVGQNFGVGDMERIRRGYGKALRISAIFGLGTTALLTIFPRAIFSLFMQEPEALNMGVIYLRIIGLSQVFMCIEIVTMASFNGVGKTYVPASVSLIFTSLRLPIAYLLAVTFALGLNGVWWSISITSMIKGVLLVSLFTAYLYKQTHSTDYKSKQEHHE